MGRPKRGALRPLALLLLLLLLRLQHPAAAADPLLGGQGACGWSPVRLCAGGAANKARAAWPPAEGLRQGPPAQAWQRCRAENGAGTGFSGPKLPFNLCLVPEAPCVVGSTLRHLLLGDGLSGGQAGRELCGG